MSAEHSPLPWSWSGPDGDGSIRDPDGTAVVPLLDDADAALIVHRVNTWEGLRDALRAIAAEERNLDERDGIPGVGKESPETTVRVTQHFVNRMGWLARHALEAAEANQ